MGMDLRGLSRNGRAVSWALEMVPMRDGWVSAEADGWLMTALKETGYGPDLPHTSAAALKTTLRSLERRSAVQLRAGTDGRLYARHVNRADVPTETTALLPGNPDPVTIEWTVRTIQAYRRTFSRAQLRKAGVHTDRGGTIAGTVAGGLETLLAANERERYEHGGISDVRREIAAVQL